MRAELINPFLHAAKNVLETMCQTRVIPQKPALKKDKVTYGDVTGIIGLNSDKVTGSMILSFEKRCILKIVANMLMEDPRNDVDNEIVDAVGELTNMICGGAKAQLAKLNQRFEMAQPSMIMGKGVEIGEHSKIPTITIPFQTDVGNFVIEAHLADRK